MDKKAMVHIHNGVKKSYNQPRQHIKKQRHPVKAMDFPVVMYGCESWTIRKAEC